MPKKKGKKKSAKAKKSNLTEEEKLALKEQEALMAAEKGEKRIEMARQFLKEKLDEEERNSRINRKKLDAQWRTILRQAKAEELLKELQILTQTFERVLDRKNAILQSLVRDIKEAQMQEQKTIRSHLRNMDRLVDFQTNDIDELHGRFNEELNELKQEFLDERERVVNQHQQEMTDIKDITFAMQTMFDDRLNEEVAEFNSKADELKTKNLEARSTLKSNLESKITELWDMFQQALKQYESSTAEKRTEFERLRDKDKQSSKTIEQQMRKLQRLQDTIQAHKQQMQALQKESDSRNRELKNEKESVLMQFQLLKAKMSKSREREKENLTKLTVESRECADKLKEKLALAEKILKQAEICRKLETEDEKVLPFYQETLTEDDVAEASGAQLEEAPEELPEPTRPYSTAYTEDNRPVEEHKMLDGFYKRYNKALLDKLAVDKEKEALNNENQQLRAILKQYLDGISVNAEILEQDNTLLVINNHSSLPNIPVGDSRVRTDKPNIIEATQTQVVSGGRHRAR